MAAEIGKPKREVQLFPLEADLVEDPCRTSAAAELESDPRCSTHGKAE